MARRGVRNQRFLGLQRENSDFALRVDADQLVGAELEEFGRCLPRQRKDGGDPALSKHIDLPTAKLGVAGTYGQKRLDWIVCKHTYLRVHTAPGVLQV